MPAILAYVEGNSASPTFIVGAGVALIALGALLLFESVRRLRQSRVVAHISGSPIGKLNPGLVRVFGCVEGDNPLVSPLTGSPCFYYESLAQERDAAAEDGCWSTLRKDTARRDFCLNDGTSRVLVQLDRAEFDLPSTLEASLKPGAKPSCRVDPSLGLPPLTEREMRALLHWDWKSPRAAAMAAEPEHAEPTRKRKWWILEAIDIGGFEIELNHEAKEYKLTETCLLNGREYSIVATCEKASGPGGQPSQVLKRGAEETTFVISAERGDAMARSLRKKALQIMVAGIFLLAFGVVMVFTSHRWTNGDESMRRTPQIPLAIRDRRS